MPLATAVASRTAHPGSIYRPDIDGLRAISVAAVVLYHYGAVWLPGGFTGVDVFFVISGFLITSILRKDYETQGYSLRRFYVRRIRRIVPALLVMIAACLAVGWLVLFPNEYLSLAESAAYSTLGFGNLYFYSHTGYFDRAAEFQPLLHTWSLGVEEQFYLVWPAALWLLLRMVPWRPLVGIILAATTALGFAYAVRKLGSNPVAAFYLPHPRGWELSLGATVAFLPPLSRRLPSLLTSVAGLALISWSFFCVTSGPSFPGFDALFACLGAALLVWPRTVTTPITALLSLRPLVGLGLVSFSLYLWHWPVLVFFRLVHLEATPSLAETAAMLALVLALSIASYVFIEQPFRRPQARLRFPIGAAACVLAAAAAIHSLGGVPWRLPPESVILADAANDWNAARPQCHRKDEFQLSLDKSCTFGDTASAPAVAMWGDSHGVEIGEAIGDRLARNGRSILMLTYSSCPPAIGFTQSLSTGCEAFNTETAEFLLAHPEITTIYLAAYHEFYNQGGAGTAYELAMERSVATLTSAGRRVVLVSSNPEPGYSLPLGAARLALTGRLELARVSQEHYRTFSARADAMIDRLVASYPGVARADQSTSLCDGVWCPMIRDGKAILFDDNHLSRHGAAIAVSEWDLGP